MEVKSPSHKESIPVHQDHPILGQLFQYWDAVKSISARNDEEERLGKKKRRNRRKYGKPSAPTLSQVQREVFGTEDQSEIRVKYKNHFLSKGNRSYVKGAKCLGEIGEEAIAVLLQKGLSGQGLHWKLQELLNIAEMDPAFIRGKVLQYESSPQFNLRFDNLLWKEYFLQLPQEKWSSRFKSYVAKMEITSADTVTESPGAEGADTEEVFRRDKPYTATELTIVLAVSSFEKHPRSPDPAISGDPAMHTRQDSNQEVLKENSELSQQFLARSENCELSAAKRTQYLWASHVSKHLFEKGNGVVYGLATVWLEYWYEHWGNAECFEDKMVIRALGKDSTVCLRLSKKDVSSFESGNPFQHISNNMFQFIVTNCFGWDTFVRDNIFWIPDLKPIWKIVVDNADNAIHNQERPHYEGLWYQCLSIIPVQHEPGLWSVAVVLNLNTIESFVHSGPFPATKCQAHIRYFGPVAESRRLQKRMKNILIQTLPGRKLHLDGKYRANISLVLDEKIMECFDSGSSLCDLEGNVYNILRIIYVFLSDKQVWLKLLEPNSHWYFLIERVCISYVSRVARVGVAAAKKLSRYGLIAETCQPSASLLLTAIEDKSALESCGVDLKSIFSRPAMEHALDVKQDEIQKLEETVSRQDEEISRLRGILEETDGIYIQSMRDTGKMYSTDDGSKILLKELENANNRLKRKDCELVDINKKVKELKYENILMQRNLNRIEPKNSDVTEKNAH